MKKKIILIGTIIYILGMILTGMVKYDIIFTKDTTSIEEQQQLIENYKEKIEYLIQSVHSAKQSVEKEIINIKLKIDEIKKQQQLKETIATASKPKLQPVFDHTDITKKCNISYTDLHNMLKDNKLQCLAKTFLLAEETYNINALALLSIVSLESGYGTSQRANNGSNNLTGYAVYSDKSRGAIFSSWDECVMRTAKLLRNSYINNEGMFHINKGYNGKSLYEVNHYYSQTSYWHRDVTIIGKEYIRKLSNKN